MRPELNSSGQPSPPTKAAGSGQDTGSPTASTRNNPTSFFMASEAEVEKRERANSSGQSVHDSTYGVRSINEPTQGSGGDVRDGQDTMNPREKYRRRSTIRPQDLVRDQSMDSLRRPTSSGSSGSSPPRDHVKTDLTLDSLSQPLTPVSFSSPVLGSEAPSSLKSFDERSMRIGDDDEMGESGSQAIESDDDEPLPSASGADLQLIMPSIMMPKRRPYTNQGKELGRLRVLLAGPSGVGKTSLIKSMVQACDHIVHVDSIPSNTRRTSSRSRSRSRAPHANPTRKVTEVHASTKPYPQWWTDLEESTATLKRRITNEDMLERNLCFVDTPGYDNGTSVLQGIKTTVDYIEGQMAKSTMVGELKDSDLLSMLSGNGGVHVDVVLYLISHDLKPADVEYLRQLNHLTSLIPVLAKSDTTEVSLEDLKPAIQEQLRQANIQPISLPVQSSVDLPYAVCCSPSSDLESMDASLLMQSDILPPLTASDLPYLVQDLISTTNILSLKHASARKLIRWRSRPRSSPLPVPYTAALSPSLNASASPSNTGLQTNTQTPAFSALTHPRLAAHTQREERLANIRLANWAGQLHRSLAAERARYEELNRQERQGWLKSELEKYKDIEVDSGEAEKTQDQLVTIHESGSRSRARSSGEDISPQRKSNLSSPLHLMSSRSAKVFDSVDPLGVLGLCDSLQFGGWIALRVIGACSIAGGVAMLIARMSGYGMNFGTNFWQCWVVGKNDAV